MTWKHVIWLLLGSLASTSAMANPQLPSPFLFASIELPTPAHTLLPFPNTHKGLLLGVEVNHQRQAKSIMLIQDLEGSLFVKQKDLENWRVILPTRDPIILQGQNFYNLNHIEGIQYQIDKHASLLKIDLPAPSFKTDDLSLHENKLMTMPIPQPGGFFNYDFVGQKLPDEDNEFNGDFEFGVFNKAGVGIANFLVQNIGQEESKTIRLNTTWTVDRPQKMQSLR